MISGSQTNIYEGALDEGYARLHVVGDKVTTQVNPNIPYIGTDMQGRAESLDSWLFALNGVGILTEDEGSEESSSKPHGILATVIATVQSTEAYFNRKNWTAHCPEKTKLYFISMRLSCLRLTLFLAPRVSA